MLATKRGGGDLTKGTNEELTTTNGGGENIAYYFTSSNKLQKLNNVTGETIDLLPSGSGTMSDGRLGGSNGSGRGVFECLSEDAVSKMTRSVVSLFLIDGGVNVFACSGVPIDRSSTRIRVLTSANLATTLLQKMKAGCGITIHVRDTSNNVAKGLLEKYDSDRGFAFITIPQSLDVCLVHLHHGVEFMPHNNIVAVQLIDSGACQDGKLLSKSFKASDGMPFFDGDGNFVAMIHLLDTGKHAYMQLSAVIELLEQYKQNTILRPVLEQPDRPINVPPHRRRRRDGKHYNTNPAAIELNQDQSGEDLNSFGYPKKPETAMEDGMVLVNTFEEVFGDSYESGEGVWSVLSKSVAEHLSHTVVSLASFNGKTRFFACSGILVEWNGCTTILTSASLVRDRLDEKKIVENLRIDVLLPNKQQTEGTLEHYSLHYNVAIVSFKCFGAALSTANVHDRGCRVSRTAVAVGRCFESNMLMATGGGLSFSESRFDCDALLYSTCEITKAGIGGPLVDFEGKFVGMNFYDWKKGTPYLPQRMIVYVLAHFEKKSILADVDVDGFSNRWPVPKPLWCSSDHPHPKNEEKIRCRPDHGHPKNGKIHVPRSSLAR